MLGLLLVAAAGSFAGLQASLKLGRREKNLELFSRFVQNAETEIQFSGLPVADVVERHGGELSFLRRCTELCREGMDFSGAWDQAVHEDSGFSGEDASLLLEFGKGFGATDVQGQAAHCRLTLELTRQRLQDAREERRQKARLYRMLGVLGGIGAALFFC